MCRALNGWIESAEALGRRSGALTRLRSLRYRALRVSPSGEEVRDGPYVGGRGGIAPTAAPLRPWARALRGSGLARGIVTVQ